MADPISVQDLDKFLAKPLPVKAAKLDPVPLAPTSPIAMGPGKPMPQIKDAADLDSFLKQPIQSFEITRKSQAAHQRQQETGEGSATVHHKGITEGVFTSDLIGEIPVVGSGVRVRDMYRKLTTSSPEEERVERRAEKFHEEQKGQPLTLRSAGDAAHIAMSKFVTGQFSPGNVALLLTMEAAPPVKVLKLLTEAGFGYQAMQGMLTQGKAGIDSIQQGNSAEGVENLIGALVSGGFAFQMGKGGLGTAREMATHFKTEYHLDKLADDSFQKPWDKLDQRQQAAILYDLAKQKNAPVTAAMAMELAKQPPQDSPGFEQAAPVATAFQDATQQARMAVPPQIAPARAMEPPPPPPVDISAPDKVHREGPEYYAINVRPMSPADRDARRYSLTEARTQLDEERRVATQEEEARDAAERDRQRIAKERKESAEGEAAYRAAREGRALVVQDRRGLRFDSEAAEQNYGEYQRLGDVLDNIAVEHMYEDTVDMVRSLRTERNRGIDLKEKYGDWAENALKTEARQKEYLKLSDPRALEPQKADILRDSAQDMRLAEREMNMREAADRIDHDAKSNVADPETFERHKAEADEARKRAEELRTQRDEAAGRRASQIADRQIYPVGAPIDLTMGSATEVILPSGRRLPAHYAMAFGDQVVTSHNPMTFQWNEDFGPRQAQPRDYATNAEAQAGVITGGNSPEPDRIHTDDPSPHNGPPVIRRDGLVLGGNGRTMRLQRAYRLGNGDSVFRHLRSKLEQFGLDSMPELEKKPTLVRVLDDDVETAEDLFVLGRDLDRTETMGFDPAEQAVVAGRAMSDHMMEWGAAQMDMLGEDASVRDFMRARGGEIIQRMIDSGMVEPTKRAAYVSKNGEMTEAAKDLFEAAWLGKIVDDADLLKTTPKEVLRKLSRAVPGLVKAKVAGSMWDISPEVKDSLKLWKRIDSVREALSEIGEKKDSLVDKYLHPQDFENGTELMDYGTGTARETPHPAVEAIAKLLEKSQIEVRDGFVDYGNEAEGKQATLGPPPEPVDSFNRYIGSKIKVEVQPDQWAVPMAPINKEAVLAPETPVAARSESRIQETQEKAPSPLETTSRPQGNVVDKLRAVLSQHPGFQGIADEVLQAADILSRNGMGKPLNEILPEILADVRTEGTPGQSGLEQSTGDIAGWARRAGKKLMITPYGEQLGLFGGAEQQFVLRNRIGDERLVLKSELMRLRDQVPQIADMVDAEGNVKQSELFGVEEENLFGPGPDEDDGGPQGSLFQEESDVEKLKRMMSRGMEPPPSPDRLSPDLAQWQPPPDLGAFSAPDYGQQARTAVEAKMGALPRSADEKLKDAFAKSKSVGQNESDWFAKAKAELFPGKRELSNDEMHAVSTRALTLRKEAEPLAQGKKGATEFLDDGKAVLYLYKTADASTFMHEFFHVMRRHLMPDDIDILEDWLKIKDKKWGRRDEETAARAFEHYHRQREAKALPDKVRAVFAKIQDAMRQIYAAIKGSPLVKPSKEVSALFDRWYGMEVPPEAPGDKVEAPPEPPKEEKETKFKFGNTQANIPEDSAASKALDSVRGSIADEDLAGKGKDIGGNHVTIRYGIKGDDSSGIRNFLSQQKPFEAKLGKTDTFPPTEQSDGAAVIVASIEAPELHRLNAELAKHGEFTDPSFEYSPHATVGYVKPEAAEKYVGLTDTEGKTFRIDEVAITDRNGKEKIVKLGEGKTVVPLDVPQDLGPKKEKIVAAADMETPPLTAEEREGAELKAEGGRRLLDTGKVRVRVFPEWGEAEAWAKTNSKKIKSLQLYKLKDGRFVADFVPNNEKVLFQTDETSDINREIAGLQKRLMSIMPEAQRATIAQRLFDLEDRRRTVAAPAPSLEPIPGKTVRLWTPDGEEAVVPKPLEVSRGTPEAQPVRASTNEVTKLPEPPRFGGVPERPEPSRVSRPEPAPGRTVRSGRETEKPRVVGGQPTGALREVKPIRIDTAERPAKPPVYSDKDWSDKVKLYELPENAPTPTVGISNNLARMLMGGQRYIVESALSGLDRWDSFILATPTGSGKTYSSSAIMHHILQEKPDAQILILTTSRNLIDAKGGFKQVASDFGVDVQDLDPNGPTGQPGVYAETWSGSGNRPGIETHPWDLIIADEVQEARKWWSSQRGARMKEMGKHAHQVLYMSATPFHCLAPGTLVLMYDGTIKQVEDVCVGDLVMGPDSKPRRVRGLSHGFGQMYEVTPKKGDSYKVNENHVLSLRMAGRTLQFDSTYGKRYPGWRAYPQNSVVNISVHDYLQTSKGFRGRLLGYRTGVDFPAREVPVDPYWLGLWLGDGMCREAAICVAQSDLEIKQYVQEYASKLGLIATEQKCASEAVKIWRISRAKRGSVKGKFGAIPHNPLTARLRDLGVTGKDSINKNIPNVYKANSRDVRLKLLAGIIDSDGTCDQKGFSISTKSKRLASDILFLARSLGFGAYAKPIFYAKSKRPDLPNWSVRLSGDLEVVPTLLPRKQCRRRKFLNALQDQPLSSSRNAKDVLKVGVRVEACEIGEFYGFELDGDQLFVLGDFTVTHNSALEIGHMDKLGLWKSEGYDTWARQFGVNRDAEGNYTGGNAPLKLTKLREQLVERGQFINVPKDMSGYSAHFGVVPMDGKTKQGLENIKQAMQLAENYFDMSNKRGKIQPTRAQAVTLAKRWLEYQRLPQAIELGKKLESEGWKVIFFSENKKEFEDLFEFLNEADEGTGGRISQLLPRFRSVTDVLQEAFGDDVGIFAGKHSAARDEELSGFNEGDKKHIYATYGAGGVGVSLHDTVGTAPRAVVYLGPPWSGISFDQALGRPWRYGTRSNVRAYFLFSNAQAEMDVVTRKVAPRMESLRAMVSGVHMNDPLVNALRDVPENREATLDYELGNEHKTEINNFTKTGDVRTVTSYSEMPIVHADEAKNKGMKLPGGDGATAPNVVRLFQDGADEDIVPTEMESQAMQTARSINVDIADAFIASGAAPGNAGTRVLTPIERRIVADAVMVQAEGAARGNPNAPTQEIYTAWQNAMTQLDAILSADRGGGGMEPPPGGIEAPPPKPETEEVGNMKALGWYFFTNGRDVIRNATKAAGVPEIGQKLARDIASYHVLSGNISGPWVDEYWRILRDNNISKDEHKVLALTMANREEHRPWIDRELMRLRAETPMNERIGKAVDQAETLRKKVLRKMQDSDVYLTVWDAETGRPRKVMYQSMETGEGYWPRKYDYDEVHTVEDPESGTTISFTLREMTGKDAPGGTKKEKIVRGMMERHGLSRAAVEDWLGSRKRPVPLVGHVERARESDLPFFRTDPNVMISYLEGAGELLSRKKYFGQDGDKVAGTLAQISNKKMRDISKGIVDSLLQRNPMEDESRWMLRLASDWTVLSKMTFSSIKVLGHPVHGALFTNMRSFFGGLAHGVFNYREAAHQAELSGSVMEQTKVEMLSEYGVNKKGLGSSILKYNMWQGAYKWGRVVADATGRIFMDKTALPRLIKDPNNELMRRQLKEHLLLDDSRIDAAIERGRWTDDDHHWAGKAFSDKVMYTFDPTELPAGWRAHSEDPATQGVLSAVRMATLLRGYQFKTHALLKDAIYDEIKNHGNFRPLLPFLTLYPLLGQLIWTMTSLATANKKHFRELLDDKNWTAGANLERYVDDIAHQIGDSALLAAIKAIHQGREQFGEKIMDEYVIGAIPSDLLRTGNTALNVAFAKNNRQRQKAVTRYAKETFPAAQALTNLMPPPHHTTIAPLPPPPGP